MSFAPPQLCPNSRNDSHLLNSHLHSSQPRLSVKVIALLAEDHVADLLRRRGWTVLGRNFRAVGAELDIVARKGPVIVIFEVKARRRLPRDYSELVPRKKRLALERGARIFFARRRIHYQGIGFDLVVVHFRDQFQVVGLKYFPRIFEAIGN